MTVPARRLRVVPDEIIDPDHDPHDDWDDAEYDDGPCCHSAGVLGRVLGEMRTAAEELETKDPGAREVGRWLRVRAQQAAIQTRSQ